MITDDAADRYDLLEHRLRDAIAEGVTQANLVGRAGELHDAGKVWTQAAYEQFFELREQHGATDRRTIEAEIEAETAEALADLWADLQDAWAGRPPPVRTSILQKCVAAAKDILAGTLSPQTGASRIWTLLANEGRPYPDELVAFVGLASELQDSPEHRVAYEDDVRSAAEELVQRHLYSPWTK